MRPATESSADAKLTAVQLPAAEAPSIAYQDALDQPRAFLESSGLFYTMLDLAYPAHRTLLQFLSGGNVSYERVFSWLDVGLKSTPLFSNSVAVNLDTWDTNSLTLSFPTQFTAPYVVTNDVNVGDRILPPAGRDRAVPVQINLAGYIVQSNGTSFNPLAYIDPFGGVGFALANLGAIIPVNAMPGSNSLEVWWFRQDTVNLNQGFQPSYWPKRSSATTALHWPASAPEIIMANNAGSGPLDSLQAKGTIYRQPDWTMPGYNPNEEHAIMLGGQAYALRDDLNNTNPVGYTSDPFVLINYMGSDGRPMMAPYHVRREAPEKGQLFDYIVDAGTMLQAPMPLPLLTGDLPIEGAGAYATNYNTSPFGTLADLPMDWIDALTNTPYGIYSGFTFQDRKHNFWVYRGLHAGLPTLQAGDYDTNSGSFGPLPAAVAVVSQPFAYFVHASRRAESLVLNTTPTLPPGLEFQVASNGIVITGYADDQLAGDKLHIVHPGQRGWEHRQQHAFIAGQH